MGRCLVPEFARSTKECEACRARAKGFNVFHGGITGHGMVRARPVRFSGQHRFFLSAALPGALLAAEEELRALQHFACRCCGALRGDVSMLSWQITPRQAKNAA